MNKESKSYQKLEEKVKTLLWEHLKELRLATQEVHNALPSETADKITDPLFTAIVDSEDAVVERITQELSTSLADIHSNTDYISSDIIKESEDYLILMDEYVSMESEYEEVSNDYEVLYKQWEDLELAHEELKELNNELDMSFDELEQEHEELLNENRELLERIEELENELDFLKEH